MPAKRNFETLANETDLGFGFQKLLTAVKPRESQIVRYAPDLRLRAYAEQAWSVVEPGRPFVANWHHDAMAEHLEACSAGEILSLVITVPPRHTKSLFIAVFWPTWEWTHKPYIRWLFSSYAASLSIRDSLKCRRVIESAWYQRRWGHRYQLVGDQNTKVRYENNRTGYRIATSVEGSATGEGGDRIVVDDPHNIKEKESDTVRQSTLDWWDEVMSTRFTDPSTTVRVIVMQRSHEKDLVGHVLSKDMGFDHLDLPAEYDGRKMVTSIGWSDPRMEDGELLWKERFTAEVLAKLKKSLGSFAYAAQFQQRPVPAGGGIIKQAWFRFWRDKPRPAGVIGPDYELLPPVLQQEMSSWDMAFKEEADSSYVVGQYWARLQAKMFFLDQVRDRMDFPSTLKAFRLFHTKHPKAKRKAVEDKANGPAVMQTLRNEIPGIVPIDNKRTNVESRTHSVSPYFEAGNIYVPDPTMPGFEWVHDFIAELIRVPKGEFDDQAAAAVQAIMILTGATRASNTIDRALSEAEKSKPSDAAQASRKKF